MSIAPLLNYFNKHVELNKKEEEILASKITPRKYLKNQYIVQQGDICRNINFVLSGCAKMFYIDNEGQEHIVLFGIKDWWCSDLGSLITQSPSDYNIQCIEPTEVLQISFKDQEALYNEIPKLERVFRKLLEKALVAAQKRIVRNFSMTAKERYLVFKELYPTIEQRIPQYMIASYLGITKEFLSKIKSQLIFEQ